MTLIAIDPGHAKSTAGKRSPDGSLLEYEFNRAVAKRLKYHLDRHGFTTFYTTYDETADLSLTGRCNLANSKGADLFISIHANAHGNGSEWTTGNGWEIYCYKIGTTAEKLAKKIQAESIPFLGIKDRGVKVADFTVLIKSHMPAVLIEHGFYTNKAECEKLKSASFREKCAIADAKGILAYYGVKWVDEKSSDTSNKTTLYRVQCGAFAVKENAVELQNKLHKAGFTDAYITTN